MSVSLPDQIRGYEAAANKILKEMDAAQALPDLARKQKEADCNRRLWPIYDALMKLTKLPEQ
ncbi:hypothetical protein QE363_001946 [Sphingomonas sp. SORGH_AS870]|uniref:hypothetical protein n=1 Tax=Sphingomonas sp. SORGH_AS_0870 TaxID=3041801 RepID=UPI00285A4C45|nr:hypothetical protein [Sphingomonas sp. SORGH_AS_0870]MDR6146153.1 hypothetical protein [Sphingomonas sp. SORGH_AS_0870]